MLILAIHTGHNATVGLIQDGRVIGLLSQEKCDNVKNSAAFPAPAIDALLEECGMGRQEIDMLAIASKVVYPPHCYDYLFDSRTRAVEGPASVRLAKQAEQGILGNILPGIFKAARQVRVRSLEAEGKHYLSRKLEEIGLGDKPVEYIDHHTCHALAAYHGLAEDEEPALIFTADGSGDGLSATVSVVRDGMVQRIAATPASASLGGIYSNTTRFLGMKILEHEYKVMGLAAYCKGYEKEVYERVFAPVIWLDPENPLVFRSKLGTSKFYDYLTVHAVGERFDNIAGAVQMLLENRVIEWIRAAITRTGIRNIYTGGGLFMNVKLNKRIQEMEEVGRAHFLPSCGDESNPIGAGYAVAIQHGDEPKPLDHVYLGISYDRQELADFIECNGLRNKYEITEPKDIEAEIASLLAERHVVARFSGRCEWGARSLGNRAILAHPSHLESFYIVNDLIKARDFWMPFAPTVLDSAAPKYLKGYDPKRVKAPYMMTAFSATEMALQHLRAALHQGDHTLRAQVLEEKHNPSYYRLIKRFEALTGVGAVLNTSFNLHAYPLVATAEQALMTFERSGLRILALGPFLIKKR